MTDDGTAPLDPTSAYTTDTVLDKSHVLREYSDGSWALWHPDCCPRDCDFQMVVVDSTRPAHWEDMVADELRRGCTMCGRTAPLDASTFPGHNRWIVLDGEAFCDRCRLQPEVAHRIFALAKVHFL